jgi:hypothetical protein
MVQDILIDDNSGCLTESAAITLKAGLAAIIACRGLTPPDSTGLLKALVPIVQIVMLEEAIAYVRRPELHCKEVVALR